MRTPPMSAGCRLLLCIDFDQGQGTVVRASSGRSFTTPPPGTSQRYPRIHSARRSSARTYKRDYKGGHVIYKGGRSIYKGVRRYVSNPSEAAQRGSIPLRRDTQSKVSSLWEMVMRCVSTFFGVNSGRASRIHSTQCTPCSSMDASRPALTMAWRDL